MKTTKMTAQEKAERNEQRKAAARLARHEAALAKMSPAMREYWQQSAGMSVLGSMARGETTVVLAR